MRHWLLLRGLSRESRHWGRFPAQLAAADGDARVVALDLPGNGRRCRERSPARIEDMVEAYRRELRERGLVPPHHLLALSLGGMVAVAWADRYPGEVAALVLINTSLRRWNPLPWRLRPAAWTTLLRIALAGGDPARQERLILALTSCSDVAAAPWLADWIAWRRECPVSPANAYRQLWAAARFGAPDEAPRPPTLLLASDADRLVDPRCSRQLAERWRAPLRRHDSAGHDLPLDDGPWVAAQVAEWLAQPGGGDCKMAPFPAPRRPAP